jgi:two-component system sensor histidine kinase VicK
VLLNLQSNALKFTPDHGEIRIICKVDRSQIGDPGVLEVQVVDNGVGILEEDQRKLFKLFGKIQ